MYEISEKNKNAFAHSTTFTQHLCQSLFQVLEIIGVNKAERKKIGGGVRR